MHRSAFVRIFKVGPALRGADRRDRVRRRRRPRRGSPPPATNARRSRAETALAQTLDFDEVEPNPARDKRVRLPKERKPHIPPPLADHVERVADLLARQYVLPLLVIDWAGPRVSELETAEAGDLDEGRQAIRVRPTSKRTSVTATSTYPTTCSARSLRRCRRARTATRGAAVPRPDRRQAADGDHGACKATGTPHFSPARAAPPPRVAALQAHRVARRGRRAARRLEAGRGRPLRLRADRLPRGRPHDRARPRESCLTRSPGSAQDVGGPDAGSETVCRGFQ